MVMSKSRKKKITSWTQKTPRIIKGGTYRPNKRQLFTVIELRYCDDPERGVEIVRDYFTKDGYCSISVINHKFTLWSFDKRSTAEEKAIGTYPYLIFHVSFKRKLK